MNRLAPRLLSLFLVLVFLGRAGGAFDMSECPPERAAEPVSAHHEHHPTKQAPKHSAHQSCKCIGGQCCSLQVSPGRSLRPAAPALDTPSMVPSFSRPGPALVRFAHVLPPSTAPPASPA